jgi:hypothetical protein
VCGGFRANITIIVDLHQVPGPSIGEKDRQKKPKTAKVVDGILSYKQLKWPKEKE